MFNIPKRTKEIIITYSDKTKEIEKIEILFETNKRELLIENNNNTTQKQDARKDSNRIKNWRLGRNIQNNTKNIEIKE